VRVRAGDRAQVALRAGLGEQRGRQRASVKRACVCQ
jgi:hypothetical protein